MNSSYVAFWIRFRCNFLSIFFFQFEFFSKETDDLPQINPQHLQLERIIAVGLNSMWMFMKSKFGFAHLRLRVLAIRAALYHGPSARLRD